MRWCMKVLPAKKIHVVTELKLLVEVVVEKEGNGKREVGLLAVKVLKGTSPLMLRESKVRVACSRGVQDSTQ